MKLPEAEPFLYPVDGSVFPDYYETIKRPMDLTTLKDNLASYESKEAFFADAKLIASNCARYNAPGSDIIAMSEAVVATIKEMIVVCNQR